MRKGNDRKLSVTDQYHKQHCHGAACDKSVKGTAHRCSAPKEGEEEEGISEKNWERLSWEWTVWAPSSQPWQREHNTLAVQEKVLYSRQNYALSTAHPFSWSASDSTGAVLQLCKLQPAIDRLIRSCPVVSLTVPSSFPPNRKKVSFLYSEFVLLWLFLWTG